LQTLLTAALAWQAFRVVNALEAYELELAAGTATVAGAEAIAAAVFDLEGEMAALISTIRPFLLNSAGRAIVAMERDYGIGAGITTETDFIRALLQSQENRFARDVTATSVRGIRDQLAEGIAAGESFYQLRERILGYYSRQQEWRAGLAAQYEPATAYEAVRSLLAQSAGMTHKRWVTMGDPAVCENCAMNERAGPIPISQPFPSGDSQPLQHVGCRCFCVWSAEPSDGERSAT